MNRVDLTVDGYEVSAFSPGQGSGSPVIYTHFAVDEAEAVCSLLKEENLVLISIQGIDWNCDMSPWPAKRAFREGGDFSGGADAYLEKLTKTLIPATEESLGLAPKKRMIAGYSLSGLFSVYVLYKTELFLSAASMSGSLWYDGFLNFIRSNRPVRVPERMYFSLGDKERFTKNSRFAAVEDCTREVSERMAALGATTVFERNPGNHFENVPERVARGIRWLIRDNC